LHLESSFATSTATSTTTGNSEFKNDI